MVKLTFKTPSKEVPLVLDVNLQTVSTVEKLKAEVAAASNSTVANIKLIHKGNIPTKIRKNIKRRNPLRNIQLC
jgi:hypothetical protein